jgi:hypothetical protein
LNIVKAGLSVLEKQAVYLVPEAVLTYLYKGQDISRESQLVKKT